MTSETYPGQKGGMLDLHFPLNIIIIYKCYHVPYLDHFIPINLSLSARAAKDKNEGKGIVAPCPGPTSKPSFMGSMTREALQSVLG